MERLGWMDGGRRRRLFVWEEKSILLCYITLFYRSMFLTKWKWLLDPINCYSVLGVYRFYTTFDEPVDRNLVVDVWHKHIPSKVSLFVWRLLCNRLSAKDNLVRRSILQFGGIACASACGNSETANHLFIGCRIVDRVWYHVRTWLGLSFVAPSVFRHHFVQFSNMAGMPRFSRIFFRVIWLACI